MRILYLDESGTSANEGVTVVVAIVVDADRQWTAAKSRLDRLVAEYVPASLREAFLVHSTDLLNGRKNPPEWSRADRTALLREVAAIPGNVGMPLCLGVVRRGALGDDAYKKYNKASKRIRSHNADHLVAFQYCLTEAERYLRGHCEVDEIAVAVYEDTDEMRGVLRGRLTGREVHPYFVPNALVAENHPEVASISQKIIDVPHFARKSDAPLLQIADVCAFIIRSWLEGREIGATLLPAIIAQNLDLNDYQKSHFGQTWIPPHDESARALFGILSDANIKATRDGMLK